MPARTGAPVIVLHEILGFQNIQDLVAAEQAPAAAHLLLQNTAPHHCFEDAAALAKSDVAYCLKHGQKCKADTQELDIYISGFVCCGSFKGSPQNSHHFRDFETCLASIERLRPRSYVLENVTGCLKATSKDNPEPFINVIMGKLRAMGQYEVTYVKVSGRPLPTSRPRVYIIGLREGSPVPLAAQIQGV